MTYISEEFYFNTMYPKLAEAVGTLGNHFKPRSLKCVEIRPAHFTITDATKTLYNGASRKLNYRFFAVETLGYLCNYHAVKHAELLTAVNKNMGAFLNTESGTFDGAYGPRLALSLGRIVDLLKRDFETRQAVASIWSPDDPRAGSLDVPCTLSLQFFADGERQVETVVNNRRRVEYKPILSLHASMRSNDLNWGTPYDVPAFASLLVAVARCVDAEVGQYHHTAGSLHLYKDHPLLLAPMNRDTYVDAQLPTGDASVPWDWTLLTAEARKLLDTFHKHLIVDKEPAHTFKRMFVCHINHEVYWSEWIKLIRWRWLFDAKLPEDNNGRTEDPTTAASAELSEV